MFPRLTRRATTRVVILLILFALFIFLCGAGHLLRFLDAADTPFFHAVNIVTAMVSVITSIYLMPFIPNLLTGADKLWMEASASKEIIAKMYPPQIRERLLNHESNILDSSINKGKQVEMKSMKKKVIRQRIQDFVSRRHSALDKSTVADESSLEEVGNDPLLISEPIADDFPHTSIMFADIANFTYWASQHSPPEAFILLESLFVEFDRIATEMGVYKVSTVGDCFIASVGVPYPRDDHAVLISLFALRCRQEAKELFVRLNSKLNTNSLAIRIGIHSGPVTAGVLRGDKARFDIFGDTVNTAQRIESTGKPNSIQISSETAQLLKQAGKGDWLLPRKFAVNAKGKGELMTFWLRSRVEVHDDLSSSVEAKSGISCEEDPQDIMVSVL
jgi:class 3 adenylate cyclase